MDNKTLTQKKYKLIPAINLWAFVVPLLVSLAVWWNPNFFTPNTYFNLGDTLFPLDPAKYLEISSFAWNHYDVPGNPNLWPAFAPSAIFVYVLSYIGVPIWIINRLWLLLPTAMVGWFTHYLYASVFEEKYSNIGGLISAVFVMLIPTQAVTPMLYLSLAGFPLFLGALIRGLKTEKISLKYILLTCVGVMFLATTPRTFYMSLLVSFLYLLMFVLTNYSLCNLKNLLFLICAAIGALIANLFWIAPFASLFFQRPSLALITSDGFANLKLTVLQNQSNDAGFFKVFRLVVFNSKMYHFLSLPLLAPLSFVLPVYAYLSLFISDIKKKLYPFAVITVVLTLFATGLHYKWFSVFYMFLWHRVPGFNILNTPFYWILQLGFFYAVLIGATTQALLLKLDNVKLTFVSIRRLKASFLSCLLLLICLVYGWGVLVGIGPDATGPWGNKIYPNHVPAMKIPTPYFKLRDYLLQHAKKGDRLLNLPWTWGGYTSYTWWNFYTMPDVTQFLMPIPVIGACESPIDWSQRSFVNALDNNDGSSLASLLGKYATRYILIHKDYYPIEGIIKKEQTAPHLPRSYQTLLSNNKKFNQLMDNEYFTLYTLTDGNPFRSTFTVSPHQNVIAHQMGQPSSSNELKVPNFSQAHYLYVPSTRSLSPKKGITISAWVYPKTMGKSQGIITKWAGTGTSSDNYGFLLQPDGAIMFLLNIDGRDIMPQGNKLTKNRWQLLVGVYDSASKEYAVYINNQLALNGKDTNAGEGLLSSSKTPLLIGAYNGNEPAHFFDGFITNVQIYSVPLAREQINELYNTGIASKPVSQEHLSAWWILQGKEKLLDQSSNNNEIISRGNPQWTRITTDSPLAVLGKGPEDSIDSFINPEFTRISSTEYKVKVNSPASFDLIFNQKADSNWVAYVNGKEVEEHLASPEGTNLWSIGQTGELEINVRFEPQFFTKVGGIISIVFYLIGFSVVSIQQLKIVAKSEE